MPGEFRFPGPTNRIAIIGDTGSGKTVAALWHLSKKNFEEMPWVILDYKHEDHIAQIHRAEEVNADWTPKPRDKGLFVMRPLPKLDDDQVEDFFRRVYERENVGLYIDEGHMLDNSDWLEILLTQGRSKRVPVIMLSQRPVDVSRYLWSNAEFYQYFPSGDKRDTDTVSNFIRGLRDRTDVELKPYWSWYYDKGKKQLMKLMPVPEPNESLNVIDEKLRPERRKL